MDRNGAGSRKDFCIGLNHVKLLLRFFFNIRVVESVRRECFFCLCGMLTVLGVIFLAMVYITSVLQRWVRPCQSESHMGFLAKMLASP